MEGVLEKLIGHKNQGLGTVKELSKGRPFVTDPNPTLAAICLVETTAKRLFAAVLSRSQEIPSLTKLCRTCHGSNCPKMISKPSKYYGLLETN